MTRPESDPVSRPEGRSRDRTAAEAHLDARGLLCPVPILLAAREIAKLPAGGRLVVEGDDPGILEDLPAWCAQTGHCLVTLGEQDGLIRGVVEKADRPPPEGSHGA